MSLTKAGQEQYEKVLEQFSPLGRVEALRQYGKAKLELERLEGQTAALKDILLRNLLESGEDSFAEPSLGTVRIQQGRETRTISAAKLLEKGITSEVIEFATEVRQGEPFVVVTVKREKEDK